MTSKHEITVTTLRLPKTLLAYLKSRALKNHRSLNAEMLVCLEHAREQEKENAPEGESSEALVSVTP